MCRLALNCPALLPAALSWWSEVFALLMRIGQALAAEDSMLGAEPLMSADTTGDGRSSAQPICESHRMPSAEIVSADRLAMFTTSKS